MHKVLFQAHSPSRQEDLDLINNNLPALEQMKLSGWRKQVSEERMDSYYKLLFEFESCGGGGWDYKTRCKEIPSNET